MQEENNKTEKRVLIEGLVYILLVSWFPYKKWYLWKFVMYMENINMELEHKELTEKIIGAAIQVHQQLGPGFIESIYEKALMIELDKRGLQVKEQQEVVIKYDDIEVGRHRLDLFVENFIVIELKAIKDLEDIHFAIVRSYLESVDKKHGLLLNFAKVKLEIKRVIYDEQQKK